MTEFAVGEMMWALTQFQTAVPAPQKQEQGKGFVWRYLEKTIEQALVLKFFRLTSNLDAACVLLSAGKMMECGALKRMLDEANDDILFLAAPLQGHAREEIHEQYLALFWEEEFDVPGEPLKSSQKRGMVKREKIQAYNARIMSPKDPSTVKIVNRSIFKTYSGYVHGHSVHILDVYDGEKFRLRLRSDRVADNYLQYPYRCLMAGYWIALSFGNAEVSARLKVAYENDER